ncbi:adhesion G-protein coupled receptor D1-like [Stylophora pistillata]|uniref:adhesion G-protein coupled receptor D1-like n=1 Tax=Stylophora pistillata TaxID=50429 RepID=UPI000C04B1DA|nr:adhesion G-protein coupled receptor D1-like [Stylophora pistillata]
MCHLIFFLSEFYFSSICFVFCLSSCWLSSENGLIWIFIVFLLLIGLLNVMILLRVIKEMTTMHQTKDNQSEKIRLGIRACLVMIPLLGVTWLFGVLSSLHTAFAYIFTIFNSTQGFMIFLLHCVKNTEIRSRFKRKLHSIFPSADNETNIKRSSEGNETASGNISIKKTITKHSVGPKEEMTVQRKPLAYNF